MRIGINIELTLLSLCRGLIVFQITEKESQKMKIQLHQNTKLLQKKWKLIKQPQKVISKNKKTGGGKVGGKHYKNHSNSYLFQDTETL